MVIHGLSWSHHDPPSLAAHCAAMRDYLAAARSFARTQMDASAGRCQNMPEPQRSTNNGPVAQCEGDRGVKLRLV